MEISLAAVYLAIGGSITLGFGIAYLVRTTSMSRMVGIEVPSASARADYRAIYGGSQIGMGGFFLLASVRTGWLDVGLVALALFAGGFGAVRLWSLASDRAGRDPQWLVGAMELAAGAIAVWFTTRA